MKIQTKRILYQMKQMLSQMKKMFQILFVKNVIKFIK